MNKLEIIEQIEQLKRNNCLSKDEYNYKINSLYKQLSRVINKKNVQKVNIRLNEENEENKENKENEENEENEEQMKINLTISSIFNVVNTQSELLELPDIKLLSKKYPLFDLFLIENNLIENNLDKIFKVQIEPIISDDYDQTQTVFNIKLFLRIKDLVHGKNNNVIIILIIFDIVFRNYSLCVTNDKFKKIFKNKIIEFNSDVSKNDINIIEKKYNLGENLFSKWLEEFEKEEKNE